VIYFSDFSDLFQWFLCDFPPFFLFFLHFLGGYFRKKNHFSLLFCISLIICHLKQIKSKIDVIIWGFGISPPYPNKRKKGGKAGNMPAVAVF